MLIPVFVSCPSTLNPEQQKSREIILSELEVFGLEPRAIGRSDYPIDFPLREVYLLSKRCSGGLILGFEYFQSNGGVLKPGTPEARTIGGPIPFATPWNQVEAGILFTLGLPLLVFRENEITGGIFDNGVSDAFIHRMPAPDCNREIRNSLHQVFARWQARVRENYYREQR
jgi:hypothetical protein